MKKYFYLIVVLIVAAGFRLYHNVDISIWHDEAFSALMIRYPWHEMLSRLALDVHPPLYYMTLKLWHGVFGDTVWSLRGFSVLFGVLGVWAMWLFVKTAFKSEKMALWAALLAAVNPFTIGFSTEARMYTFGAFFALLAAYFLTKALHEQKEYEDAQNLHMPNLPDAIRTRRHYLWHYFAYALCTAVIVLTHYYLLFTAAALAAYGFLYVVFHYKTHFRKYIPLFTSFVITGVLFLPQLKTFLWQLKSVQGGYWIPSMDMWSIPGTLWTILLGIAHDNSNPTTRLLMIVVVLFSLFMFWMFLRRTQPWEKWLVLLATIAPFCGALLFAVLAHLKGSQSSVYQERYFLYGSQFYLIALAIWLSEIWIKWLSAGLFSALCVFSVYAFIHNQTQENILAKPGMKAAARYLAANVEPGHYMFVGTSFEFFNYKYYEQTYYKLPTRPLLYTNGRSKASDMSSVEGNSLLEDADLAPSFSVVKPGDTVWMLWTEAFGSHLPDGIPANWQPIRTANGNYRASFPDIRPYNGTVIYVTEYKVN